MAKVIDFYEKFQALEKGEFAAYPIEDAVIHAYNITEDEIKPYMKPEFFKVHWTDIFDEIMKTRERNLS